MMAAEKIRPDVKPPVRERNGRLKRPTVAERAARERDVYQAEMSVVLAQPHRRGSDHPWCGSPLGRFCLAHKLKREIHDAAAQFATIVRCWRAAKGVPVDLALGVGGGGDGPSAKTVRGWEAQIFGVEARLRAESTIHLIAIRHMVVDEAEVPAAHSSVVIQGLLILAEEMGWKIGKHPFA